MEQNPRHSGQHQSDEHHTQIRGEKLSKYATHNTLDQQTSHLSSRQASFREHIIAFTIAGCVVVGVVTGLVYRDGLLADISATTGQGMSHEQSSLPISYTVRDGKLIVSTTMQFPEMTSCTFFVMFNPKTVVLQLEQATSPYDFTYAPGMENMVQVTTMVDGTMDAGKKIFEIPVSGVTDDVTITNAGILRKNNTFETIAIQKD